MISLNYLLDSARVKSREFLNPYLGGQRLKMGG